MKALHSVSVAHAKQHLSDLLGRVAYGGERIIIRRRGRPIARLIPYDSAEEAPHLAEARGWLTEDDPFFDAIDQLVSARAKHVPRILVKGRGR